MSYLENEYFVGLFQLVEIYIYLVGAVLVIWEVH